MSSGFGSFKHPLRELTAYIDKRYADLYWEAAVQFDFSKFEDRLPSEEEYAKVFERLNELAFQTLLREFDEQETLDEKAQ